MRKVTFYIDDIRYLRNRLKEKHNLSDSKIDEIVSGLKELKVIYSLFGDKYINRYELTDMDGNNVDINSLSNYEKAIVIGDCMAYFEGIKYHFGRNEPTGVIKIEETEI